MDKNDTRDQSSLSKKLSKVLRETNSLRSLFINSFTKKYQQHRDRNSISIQYTNQPLPKMTPNTPPPKRALPVSKSTGLTPPRKYSMNDNQEEDGRFDHHEEPDNTDCDNEMDSSKIIRSISKIFASLVLNQDTERKKQNSGMLTGRVSTQNNESANPSEQLSSLFGNYICNEDGS